jgi:hypothetical protein
VFASSPFFSPFLSTIDGLRAGFGCP